jgi:hypothetical protein
MTSDIEMATDLDLEGEVLACVPNENPQAVQPSMDLEIPATPRKTGSSKRPHQENSQISRGGYVHSSTIGGSPRKNKESLQNLAEKELENAQLIQQPTRRRSQNPEFWNDLASPCGTKSSALRYEATKERSQSTPTQSTPTKPTASRRSTLTPKFSQLSIDDGSVVGGAPRDTLCSQCRNREGYGNGASASNQAVVESSTNEAQEQNSGPVEEGKWSLSLTRFGFGRNESEKSSVAKETKILTEKLKSVEEENCKLQDDVTALETQLQGIQSISVRTMIKFSWTPLDDSVVHKILNEIHRGLDAWCDEYCIKDITELLLLPRKQLEEVLQLTRNVTLAPASVPAKGMIEWWSKSERWWTQNEDEDAHDPARILKALLARNLYDDLIANPFVLLDALQPNIIEEKVLSLDERRDEAQRSQEEKATLPSQGFLSAYNYLRKGAPIPHP